MTVTDSFLCDAAVGLSPSALDVGLGGRRIRLSLVLDRIVLEEERP